MHRFGMGEMRWILTVFLLWPLCGQAEERTVMQIETTIDFGMDRCERSCSQRRWSGSSGRDGGFCG